MDLTDKLQGLELSSVDIGIMVDWPDALKEDYLGIHDNVLFLADFIDRISDLTTVPATATSTGTKGQIAADASYLYVCYSVNSWARVAISVW